MLWRMLLCCKNRSTLDGYVLCLRNTSVVVNVWNVMRDAKSWCENCDVMVMVVVVSVVLCCVMKRSCGCVFCVDCQGRKCCAGTTLLLKCCVCCVAGNVARKERRM